MKIFKICFIVLFGVTIYSCNNTLCGELSGDWLSLKVNAQKKFSGQFDIENIPCEYYFINIKLKHVVFDSTLLKKLHYELYDSSKKVGWPTFIVYDKNGNYLYHDVNNGVRYKK
jgi:hypothetical protein